VAVEDFHQTAPTYGAQPTEHTVVRVAYDDECAADRAYGGSRGL
jgi:hypothetical protein